MTIGEEFSRIFGEVSFQHKFDLHEGRLQMFSRTILLDKGTVYYTGEWELSKVQPKYYLQQVS